MDADATQPRRRPWLRDVLVLIAVICLLACTAIPAIQRAREAARRKLCAHMLLQIGLGLNNHHDIHGQLPPAYVPDAQGQPRSSWRVAALPFFTSSSFYDEYRLNEPWNCPGNLALARRTHGHVGYAYHCYPADDAQNETANYVAVTGAAMAWPVPASTSLKAFLKPSHSILLVECANSRIHWLEPRDLPFDGMDFSIHAGLAPEAAPAISSRHPLGANVLFADGSVEFLAADTSPQVVKQMLLINSGDIGILRGPRDRMRFDPDSLPSRSPKPVPYTLE